MPFAFGAAITWAFDTVILSIALSHSIFSVGQALILASFISTFLHDASSTVFMWGYLGIKRELKNCWRALRSKSGKWMILAAVLGAPIGMSGYVMAINNIGPAYTAAISAFFPAVGAVLSYFVMHEKLKVYQWAGLMISLIAVAVLGWTPDLTVPGSWGLGVFGALLTVFGWGSEAVIMAYGMKDPDVSDEHALLIRQTTSTVCYAAIILPVLGGWGATIEVAASGVLPIVALSAVIGTVSYLFYYKAIVRIGPAKSMAINITYSAWAIPVGFVFLNSVPSITGIICAFAIIIGSILCATDIKELFGHKSQNDIDDMIDDAGVFITSEGETLLNETEQNLSASQKKAV